MIAEQRAEGIERLKDDLDADDTFSPVDSEPRTRLWDEIVGKSDSLRRVMGLVERVAPTNACVLIQGETGTGKELVARALHRLSPRRTQPFVKLNCAAIQETLLESDLFGHERGAFTGAVGRKVGRFELADHGTIFLDEVGEIPLEVQAKLLRVLQEQEFERVGSTRTIRVDVRLITATNRDLARMVVEGRFRSDLYYRLCVFPLLMPPLRERADDIPALVHFFIERHARRCNKIIAQVPTETMQALLAYHWPGNIRELENLIERSVILSRGNTLEVPLGELRAPVMLTPGLEVLGQAHAYGHAEEPRVGGTLESFERDHILRTLEECHWVIAGPQGAAARLGMKRTSLQYKMQKLGITRPR
ncbi:MAG TPA: sigma 54-interacting transcriptional regulator [Polyangia bacterium]